MILASAHLSQKRRNPANQRAKTTQTRTTERRSTTRITETVKTREIVKTPKTTEISVKQMGTVQMIQRTVKTQTQKKAKGPKTEVALPLCRHGLKKVLIQSLHPPL